MRKLIAIILLLFTVGLNAQTIKSNFAGYGNLRSSTGTTGPTYTFVIDGFTGNTRFQVDGPFPGTDVAIGDVVWGDCARFVVTNVVSSGYSTMTLTVQVPTEDQSFGVVKPPNNSRIAIVREFEGIFPSMPPIADGNAGALSGIESSLWSCMDNHYSTQMFTTVNTVNELVEYVGGEDVAPAVPASSYAGQKWTNSQGQIYRSNGSVWIKMGDEDIYTVRQFARARNISTEASFNALKSYFATRGGNIIVDTTVTLTANNTVASNVNVQMVKGGRFIIPNATTLTINSPFSSHPSQQCFSWTGTGTVLFAQSSVETIWPYWFGAKNDGATDCQPGIQKAINVAIASTIKNVELMSGIHIIEKGLVIKDPLTTVTLQLKGQKAYDYIRGTNITCRDTNSFGIGIQGARAVAIKGIYFQGRLTGFNPTIGQVITTTNQQWRDAYGRNSRYSPYSAIVVEPFANTIPPDGGYPGFTSEYTAANNGLSSDIIIEDVICRYFIVGIAITPSGTMGNGAEIRIDKCATDRCQYGIVTCQTQSRQVDVTSSTIAAHQVCMDGLTFGAQLGVMPNATNVQIGYCRDMINFSAGKGTGKMVNMYGEAIYRIGSWGGYGDILNFQNCEIALITATESGVADAASILDAQEAVNFVGGSITYSTGRPIEMNAAKQIKFTGTRLSSPIMNHPNGSYASNAVIYDNCKIDGVAGEYNSVLFSSQYSGPDISNLPMALETPDVKFDVPEVNAGGSYAVYSKAAKGQQYAVLTDATTVTLNPTLRTATFTSIAGGKYRIGDQLFSYDNNSSATPQGLTKASSFGVVSNISGNVITCSHIPAGITGGTYGIYMANPRRNVPTHRGTIVGGTNKLVVTSKATNRSVSSFWAVNTRITVEGSEWNYGVRNGTYVTSVVADTIYLSTTSTATFTDAEFYSTPLRAEYYSLDNNYPTSGSTTRNIGYRKGDILHFSSHPYIESAVVTKGGFLPDLKFNFKTISGTTGARPTPTAQEVGLEYYNTTLGVKQYWNGSAWVEMGVIVAPRLSGAGTIASPLDIASQGATSGQVLKFNGTNWIPGTDNSGAGATIDSVRVITNSSGLQVKVNTVLSPAVKILPASLAQSSATTGQALKWNGTIWAPANQSNLGLLSNDTTTYNVGSVNITYDVKMVNSSTVKARIYNPFGNTIAYQFYIQNNSLDSVHVKDFGLRLKELNSDGATTGQGIRYNGTQWVPSTFTDRNIFEQSGWLTSARQLSLKGNTFTFAGDSSANNTLVRIQSTRPTGGTNPLILSSPSGDLTTTFQSGPLGNFVMNYSSPLTNREFRISAGSTGMNLAFLSNDSILINAGNRIVLDANNGVVAGSSTLFPVNQGLTNLLGYNTTTRRIERINGIDSSQFALGIIPLDRIAQSGASTGQIAQWNGSKWVPVTPSATVSRPANEVVYGTGTGVTSESSFKYNSSNKSLIVTGTQSGIALLGDPGNHAESNFGAAKIKTEFISADYADKIMIHKFDQPGTDGIDTGIYFNIYASRSNSQNTIASGGIDTTANRTTAWCFNCNNNGSRQNTRFGGFGQNYEFYFTPNADGRKWMEMNGTHVFSDGTNYRHMLWFGEHRSNADSLGFNRSGEGRKLDYMYFTNSRDQAKWDISMRLENNVLAGRDSARITLDGSGPNYYALSQDGLGLVRRNGNYMDLAQGRLSISTATATPEFVNRSSSGLGFGNSEYPLTNGVLFYMGSANDEGWKMFRAGQSDTWEISKNATDLFFRNGSLTPVSVNKTAPNNSLTVASNGNVGFGTGGAPYKLYINGTSGTVGVGVAMFGNVSGETAFFASGTASINTTLFSLNTSLSSPNNAVTLRTGNNSSSSSSAQGRIELFSNNNGADVFVDYQNSEGGLARYTHGVANSQTNNPFRLTYGSGELASGTIWEIDPVIGRMRFGTTSSLSSLFGGRTTTPEGSVTASQGSVSLVNNSGMGEIYIKRSGTGNTGWEQVVTTTGTSTSISTMMREQSFTATSAQTAFSLSGYTPPAVSGTSIPIRVYRNGVRLTYVASGPTISQFTYSGTTVTTSACTTGDIIIVEYLN